MNLYDLVMIILLGLLAFRGFRRGLLRELAGLAALIVGFLLAYRLDGFVGGWVARTTHLSPTEGHVLAFLGIVAVLGIAIDLAARFLTRVIKRIPIVGGLNRLGGLLAGSALALIGIWLLTTCLLFLPASLLPFSATVSRSGTAHLVQSVTPRWSQSLQTHLHGLTGGRRNR